MRPYKTTFLRFFWLFLLIWLLIPLVVSITIRPNPSYTASASLWIEQPLTTETDRNPNADGYEAPSVNQAGFLQELLHTEAYLKVITDEVQKNGFKFNSPQEIQLLQIKISKDVVVTTLGNHVLQIEYKDIDPKLTLLITQTTVQNFVNMVTERVRSQGEIALNRFESQVKDAKTELDQNNDKLNKYLSAHPDMVRSIEVEAANNPLQSSDNIEYDLLIQNYVNSKQKYDTMFNQLERLQVSYGAFVSGRDTVIRVDNQPKIVDKLTFNNLQRNLLGAGVGLVVATLLNLMLVLIFTWADRSLRDSRTRRFKVTLKPILELDYSSRLSLTKVPPRRGGPTSYWYRWRNRRREAALVVLSLGLAVGLSRLTATTPSLGLTITIASLIVLLIMRWPAVGYLMAIFVVLFCELFPNPDGISAFTSLPLTNLNFYTSLPVSATALEAVLGLTVLSVIIQSVVRQEKLFERNISSLAVAVFAGFLVFGYIWGVYVKHGEAKTAQWEIRAPIYVVILYFLTTYLMRERRYWKVLSWLIPLGASLMGGITILRFFVLTSLPNQDDVLLYSDSLNGFDHESVLIFVLLIMWCIAKFMFGGSRAEKIVAGVLLCPALFCMVISNRRVAYAVLAVCILVILAIMFLRYRKLFIITAIVLVIVVPPYMVIFRNASGPLGAPARAFNSSAAQPGSRDYNSDLYRVVEKNNVQMTIKQGPFTGIGFGQRFTRFINFIDLDGFTLQDFTPHVQVLWLWLKVGMFGWATFWLMIMMALFKLGQMAKYAKFGNEFTLTVVAGCLIVMVMVYSYLDLGLINTRLMTLVGVSVGLLELAYLGLPRPQARPVEQALSTSQLDRELRPSTKS